VSVTIKEKSAKHRGLRKLAFANSSRGKGDSAEIAALQYSAGTFRTAGIILPADSVLAVEHSENDLQTQHNASPTLPAAQVLIRMVFTPFIAWTSITA